MNERERRNLQSDTITVIIHSYNSQDHIAECIESALHLTKNIHVIDMHSSDATARLAKNAGAAVYSVPFAKYVEPVREYGIRTAKSEWVFLLDTDERITEELAAEIQTTLTDPASGRAGFFKVPRKNIFARKKWLKYGGWWPDHQIRLIHVPHFRSWPEQIHSTPIIDGEHQLLHEPLIHYFHGDLESMVRKTALFEDIESELLYDAGRSVSVFTFFRKFAGELWRRLILKQGFKDGTIGIIECIYQAYSKTITYLYLYEKKTGRAL